MTNGSLMRIRGLLPRRFTEDDLEHAFPHSSSSAV
jgi:hypothetical protein